MDRNRDVADLSELLIVYFSEWSDSFIDTLSVCWASKVFSQGTMLALLRTNLITHMNEMAALALDDQGATVGDAIDAGAMTVLGAGGLGLQ